MKLIITLLATFAVAGGAAVGYVSQSVSNMVEVGPTPIATLDYEYVGAIAQGGHCPGNDLAIVGWNNWAFGATSLQKGSFQSAMPDRKAIFPADVPAVFKTSAQWNGDPQIVALPNGDLVTTKILYVGYTPTPSDTSSGEEELLPAGTAADEKAARYGYSYHGIEQFMISHDCGEHWTDFPSLDSSTVVGGKCDQPQWLTGLSQEDSQAKSEPPTDDEPTEPAETGDPTPAAGAAEDGSPADESSEGGGTTTGGALQYPGYDMGRMTADPWTGDLYFNTTCDGEVMGADGIGKTFDYSSRVWRMHTGTIGANGLPKWELLGTVVKEPPREMTTTADGTLWTFYCSGGEPQVQVFNAPSLPDPMSVPIDVSDPNAPPPAGKTACATQTPPLAGGLTTVLGRSISRAGPHSVRIAYVRENASGGLDLVTSYVSDLLKTKGDIATTHARVSYTHIFHAPKGSSIQLPSFIERTDTRLTADHTTNVAVLYWYESDPTANTLGIRFSVVRGNANYSAARDLTVAWTADPRVFIGHYYSGAYACLGGHTNFFPIWGAQTTPPDALSYANRAARINTGDHCTQPLVQPPIRVDTAAQHPPAATVNSSVPVVPPAATASLSGTGSSPPLPLGVLPPTISTSSSAPTSSSSAPPVPTPVVSKVVDPTFDPPVDNQLYQCANDTVYGAHLSGATKVTIGNQDFPVTHVTDTTLMFTVPCNFAPTAVPLQFSVTTPNGVSNQITVTVNDFKP